MHSPARYYPAFDKAPFCLRLSGAQALPGPVLIDLMARIDGTRSANKTVLSRMVAGGSLELSRVGRVGLYRPAGRLREDLERIRGRRPAPAWDGRLHTLIDVAPSIRRVQRERFRTLAIRQGYRPLRRGVLVAVRDRSEMLTEQIEALGVLPGHLDAQPDVQRTIAREAWDLDALGEEAERIAGGIETELGRPGSDDPMEGATGEGAFLRLHRIMRPVVAWSVRLGDLPAELLPQDWTGPRLEAAVGAAHRHYGPAAAEFVRTVVEASPYADLVESEEDPTRERTDGQQQDA